MDFELSKAQKDIQKAARDFAKGEFDKEIAAELEAKHEFPFDIWRKAGELGFIGLYYPEAYGGQDYGVLENVLVVEEFCRRDSSIGSALMSCDFASELVLRHGTDEQKQLYLPPIAYAESIFGGAFTEPDHGSDITRMATTAVRDGDDWVINGVKTFITNGGIAHHYVVLCQTDDEAGYKGQSMVMVPADAEGLEIADVGQKMGIRLNPTAELSFKDVRVPAAHLLGKAGRGFYQVLEFIDESRIEVAARALGIAQGAFDRAVAHAKSREQFGRKIGSFQATQHKVAEMATKLELARLVTYKAAWNFDEGRVDPKLASMAKYYAALASVQICDEAIQILGGWGYMTEFEVERFYRDAKITEIYEGTKEIQKNTIASAVLGKLR